MIRYFISFFLLLPFLVVAESINLQWEDDNTLIVGDDSIDVVAFEGGQYLDGSFIPYYTYSQSISSEEANSYDYNFSLTNIVSSDINTSLVDTTYLQDDFKIIANVVSSRKEYSIEVVIVPFRNSNNTISRLNSFELSIEKTRKISLRSSGTHFAENSVLATGTWRKLAINKTGIYKLTYSELNDMGISAENVSVFTSSAGQLSTMITDYVDDLQEIPVYDNGSYILFYAQSQDTWEYNTSYNSFTHNAHTFWNENYVFVTSDVGVKKRISPRTEPTTTPTSTYTSYVDYASIEPQEENIAHSGSHWYSEAISNGNSFSYTFNFDNVLQETATLSMQMAARSYSVNHYMKTYVDGAYQQTISLSKTSTSSTAMSAYETLKTYSFTPSSNSITAQMDFECDENTGLAWVDHFTINVICDLQFTDNFLLFRNKPNTNEYAEYQLSKASTSLLLWDISNIFDVQSISGNLNNNVYSFISKSDEVRQYVAVDPNGNFYSPTDLGKVDNQNLHGHEVHNMVILSPDAFMEAAEDLADVHRKEGLSVLVMNQEKIFNEFSGGKADNTAIRWFLKMFYDRSTDDNELKYFLLFGDGDVDNRLYKNGSSLIMTYESDESLNKSSTYVSDDYFGLLDDSEGNGSQIELSDIVDIGIGRIPVNSLSEANDVVYKINQYTNHSNRTDWSNTICIVADDQDNNTHINDADEIAEMIRVENPALSVKKIYLDAFEQKVAADGYSYPEAKSTSDKYIEDGILLWGFAGHGSPTQLADENMMYSSDIVAFDNMATLPLWITATCDYCPYDHNDEVSSGELVLINPIGGGISLFTTTRLVYSSSNKTITKNFYKYIFAEDPVTREKWRLGDVSRLTKKVTGTGANKRKFTLIGDPALKLLNADERWTVMTESINGQSIETFTDTLQALSTVTISGYIQNESDGSIDTDFNGIIYPTVYDKISTLQTLANDNQSNNSNYSVVRDFLMWNSTLFKGQAVVENGEFSFSFLLPKDIDYTHGKGRIEYYAVHDGDNINVNGVYEDFYIGGFNEDYEEDNEGPEVLAYMNSPYFSNGGIVNPSPQLIAEVSDKSGINTSGNGIGHDITIKLNNDASTIETINSSYISNSGDYTSGKISYKLDELEEGSYTLVLKVWDVQNNSTSTEINFEVKDDATPDLVSVYCYPNPISLSEDNTIRFVAEHDRPESTLYVTLDIFNSAGRLMYQSTDSKSTSNNEVYFDWQPSSANVQPGLYFYRIAIDDGVNISTGKSQKMIISD